MDSDKYPSLVKEKYPMVKLVVRLLGISDPNGVHHSERVAKLCITFGVYMGISDDALERLELVALLHDLGKVKIPPSIREKQGALMESEWMIIRQHPVWSRELMHELNGHIDPRVYEDVLHHHEDWGGTGYPDGLKGEQIPYFSRLLRIVDSYDALTHSRGFRMPVTHSQAIIILKGDQAEKHLYDPVLFANFCKMMEGNNR